MVPVESHILGADKTHFEAMAAVRERRASQGIRRIKKPVGPGWSRTVLATFFLLFYKAGNLGPRPEEENPGRPARSAQRAGGAPPSK